MATDPKAARDALLQAMTDLVPKVTGSGLNYSEQAAIFLRLAEAYALVAGTKPPPGDRARGSS